MQPKNVSPKLLPKKWVDQSLFWFLLIGLGNTFLSMAIMLILFNGAKMGYWLSSAIAFVIASLSSFYFNRKYSFRSQGAVFYDALRFAVVIAVCYIAAFSIARPVIYKVAEWIALVWVQKYAEQIALIAGNGIFTVFNYIGQRVFAFPHKSEK